MIKLPVVVNISKKELNKRNIKNFDEWNNIDNLYIGRNMSFYVPGTLQSKWCNKFPVKKYGRDECVRLYKEYILNSKELYNQLDELLNYKELGCWCHPELCHGDILIELLREKHNIK